MSDTGFESVTIPGGALRGVIAIAALAAVEKRPERPFTPLKVVTGASSGAIIAVLWACGWSFNEMFEFVLGSGVSIESVFSTTGNPFKLNMLQKLLRLMWKRHLDDGEQLYAFLGRLMGRHASPHITFGELSENRQCVITASSYTSRQPMVFSRHLTPELSIRDALRGSVSIIGIFEPIFINGEVVVDSGHTLNDPRRYALFPQSDCGFPKVTRHLCVSYINPPPNRSAWLPTRTPTIIELATGVFDLFFSTITTLHKEVIQLRLAAAAAATAAPPIITEIYVPSSRSSMELWDRFTDRTILNLARIGTHAGEAFIREYVEEETRRKLAVATATDGCGEFPGCRARADEGVEGEGGAAD